MSRTQARSCLLTWIALLILLGLSAGSSLLALGIFNLVSNFAIAALKAALVVVVFMRIAHSGRTVQVVAGAGIVWLALLIALSLTDFVARGS